MLISAFVKDLNLYNINLRLSSTEPIHSCPARKHKQITGGKWLVANGKKIDLPL